jgi:flagellar assembly protein FliH
MKENRLSSKLAPFVMMEYREAAALAQALPAMLKTDAVTSAPAEPPHGMSEEEVERRVALARETAIAETEFRLHSEQERARRECEQRVIDALREFGEERARYFQRVEREVVQLSLAIARKILEREAQLDPALLAAMVRIALDRMQAGPGVRVHVPATEADMWRRMGKGEGRWEVVADAALKPGACLVETELGKADFSFEAQLRDVAESFEQLLAHRPAA